MRGGVGRDVTGNTARLRLPALFADTDNSKCLGQASPVRPPSPSRFDETVHVSGSVELHCGVMILTYIHRTRPWDCSAGGKVKQSAQVMRSETCNTYFFISIHRSAFPSVCDSSWIWYVAADKSAASAPWSCSSDKQQCTENGKLEGDVGSHEDCENSQ